MLLFVVFSVLKVSFSSLQLALVLVSVKIWHLVNKQVLAHSAEALKRAKKVFVCLNSNDESL